MDRVFVFDLDDTLMWTEWIYNQAFLKLIMYLIDIWEKRIPSAGFLAQRLEHLTHEMVKEINPATGEPFGYSAERHPQTFVKFYKELCEEGWGEFSKLHAEAIKRIGYEIFSPANYIKAGLVPGAAEVFNYLKRKKDWLFLLTKGDKKVQEEKIAALGLDKVVLGYKIVSWNKTPDDFRFFKKSFKDCRCYSVGNSYFSDIKPALEAGFTGIFIPCYTWKAEPTPSPDEIDGQVIVVKKIKEIIELDKKSLI